MKKIRNGLAVLLFLLAVLPGVKAEAAEIIKSGTCGETATWTLDENGLLIVSGEGKVEGHWEDTYTQWSYFPEETTHAIVEEGITAIAGYAFENLTNLVEVQLPESVTSIGFAAFNGCENLTGINIPSAVTSIGSYAFQNCEKLNGIELPAGVTHIGYYAFYNCKSWEGEIVIPAGVTIIYQYAFYNCDGLTKIELHSDVTVIHAYAFADCDGLTSMCIPNDNTSFGMRVFSGCDNLKEVKLPSAMTKIPEGMFAGCGSLKEVDIPEGVTSFGDYAFQGAGILHITLPDNLTEIGARAFRFCEFSSIEIPDTVTTIGDYAFSCNENLISITLPPELKYIEYELLAGCTSLVSVKIPYGVKQIDGRVFYQCSSLEKIEIPETVTAIGTYAFYQCTSLTSVEIPSSVKTIGENTFYECRALADVKLPEGLTTIDEYAFFRCTNLKEINLPMSLTTIHSYAFSGVVGLLIRCYPGSVAEAHAIKKGIDYQLVSGDMWAVSGEADITVASAETNSTYSANVNHVLSEAIYTEKIVLVEKSTNLVKQYKTVTLDYLYGSESSLEITINCKVKEEADTVKNYILYQGTRKLGESSTGEITVTLDNACQGKDFYVVVVSEKGERTKTRLQLNVTSLQDGKSTSVKMGGDTTFKVTLPKDMLFFGGMDVEFDSWILPVYMEETSSGTVRVGINMKADLLNDESMLEEFKGAWKDALNPKLLSQKLLNSKLSVIKRYVKQDSERSKFAGKSLDFTFIGYGEGAKDENGNLVITAQMMCMVSGGFKWGTQVFFFNVPIVLEAGVNFEGNLEGKVVWHWTEDGLDLQEGDIALKLETAITLFGGVGLNKVAAIGVFGSGGADMEVVLVSTERLRGVENINITLKAGIKGYVGPLKGQVVLANKTWNVYSRDAVSVTDVEYTYLLSSGEEVQSIYEDSVYQLDDMQYNSTFVNEQGTEGTLISDAFLSAQPAVASIGDYTVMTYLDVDENRPAADSTVLMYSVYDKAQGTWSEPKKVDADDTMDWLPELYSNGESIRLVYTQQDGVLPEELELSDLTTGMKITTAVFDMETMSFVTLEDVVTSSDTVYVSRPALTELDGVPTLVWIQGPTEDYFGTNNENCIYYCCLTENGWSAPVMVAENMNCITELVVGMLGEEKAVVCITDTDNDLDTSDDRVLTLVSFDGTQITVAAGEIGNAMFATLPSCTSSSLLWYSGGNIGIFENMAAEASVLFGTDEEGVLLNSVERDFCILGNRIIFSRTAEEESSILYSISYENESYASAIPVITASGTITSFAADEEVAVWVDTEATVQESEVEDYSTMEYCFYQQQYDVKAAYAIFEEETMVPGNDIEVAIGVQNNTVSALKAVTVTVLDENSESVWKETLECDIASGAEGEVIVTITAPASPDDVVYTVSLAGESTDTVPDNNTTALDFNRTDLSVMVKEAIYNNTGYVVAEITNESYVSTGGSITISDVDGTVLYTEEFSSVPAQKTYAVALEESELFAESSATNKTIMVSVTANKDEYNVLNNTIMEYVPVLQSNIPYVMIVFQNGTEEISNAVYALGEDIVPEELPAGAYGWYELGDETKTIVTDFSNISTDKVYLAHIGELVFEEEEVTLCAGEEVQLQVVASAGEELTPVLVWSTSDETIATVDESGVVTAVTEGTAVITATTKDGGFSATCTVLVEKHQYEEGWMLKEMPTADAAGTAARNCENCDATEEKEIAYLVAGAYCNLQKGLSLSYSVDSTLMQENGYSAPYVKYTFGEEGGTVSEYQVVDDVYIFTVDGIAPQEMTDAISITLCADLLGTEYVAATMETSLAEYCYEMLEIYSADEYAELRTLLVDTLNYGSAAQEYTGYKEDALANAALTEEQRAWGTAEAIEPENIVDKAYISIENPSVEWCGAGLLLQDGLLLRLKLSADSIAELTVHIATESGEEWTVLSSEFVETNGGYYVYFDGLTATQMEEPIYVTAYAGATAVSNTLRYSVESYVYQRQNTSEEDLQSLLEALMKYGEAAKDLCKGRNRIARYH